ncbi:MAG: beta strand repeat-containing protein, partial [Lawsonibacter sp.]
FGLANYSVGTVDVTTASASGSNIGIGVANYTTGTVNVSTAEGSGIQGTGVFNQSSGTVNVTTATGIFYGVLNQSTGTVNVATATATGLGGTAVSNGSGTVNAGTITGSTVGSGTINTGTDVATVTLKAGTGTSCVLSSITVAASGDTTIGALPSVYKDGAYSNNWYTDNAKTTAFSGTTVTGATTLLSDYYEVASINTAAIAGVTAPVKGATPTSSITDTTEYTATISWSPADATFAASTAYTATITITPKIGYTLTGVAENYFTVAGAKTTSNIANSGVVTAVFPATASSGSTGSVGDTSSSSSTITITTEGSVTTGTASLTGSTSGGSQTVSVPSNTMTSLTKAAQKAETSGNLAIAQIDTGSDTGLENVGVTIPGTQFDSFASGTDAALQFSTGIGSVTFSSDAVGTIGAAGSGDVAFNMSVVSTSSLSAAQQATVGDRPVYSLSITVGDTTVSEFSATVTVMLPYTLQDGEKPNAIVVYYVDASGDLQMMQGAYDETTGMVTFETTHFSYYFISYNEVAFTDVAETAWYADAVTFLAARGITTGTTATTFSPNMTLTRGQYVTLLLHAYGISADTNATDNFADAGNTYYTGYLAAAKELGISSGTGDNMFAPDKAITRQEMLTMLYHALKVLDELPSGDSGKTLSDFSDTGDIANWAQDAMAFFVETGAISGNGGKLSPTDTTTRAELAQVLYNLLTR